MSGLQNHLNGNIGKLLAANRVASYSIRTEYLAGIFFGKHHRPDCITNRLLAGELRSRQGFPQVLLLTLNLIMAVPVCLCSREANAYCSMSSRTQDRLPIYTRYIEVADLKVC